MNDVAVSEQDADEMVARLNALVEDLESYPDSEIREKALDVVQITVQLYGETLRRILQSIESLPLQEQVLSRLHSDELVRAMLLIHGLLPISLEERVMGALSHLRPYLLSQGADAELVSVAGEYARLRLIRSGKGAPQIAALEQEIRKALTEAAPDLIGVEIEGFAEQIEATAKAAALLKSLIIPGRSEAAPVPTLVQLKKTPVDKNSINRPWVAVIRASGLQDGQFRIVSFGADNLLVCKIGGEVYAYRNACAKGRAPLDDALFESPMLTCLCHGYRYDLRHKGKCMERPSLGLESLPAIVEEEKVKVAL